MKVILTKDHPKLGREGTVIEVAPGYARNFLLPHRIALPATDHHVRMVEEARERMKRQEEKTHQAAQELARKLSEISCTITVAAGEEDKLFGSVTEADIAEAVGREGFKVDKQQIQLEEPIKKLGIYSVAVRIVPSVDSQVKVWVVKE